MTGAPGARLIRRVQQGDPLFGMFVCIPAFQPLEALAATPFDFLTIEAEHAATNLNIIHQQVAAMSGSGIPMVVRTPSGEVNVLKPLLDLGIDGIMVPSIETAEQARATVAATRFAPHGTRGIGGSVRANHYGRDITYYRTEERSICIWLQVETVKGMDNLDGILATEGVDVIFFGPMDLSASMGFPGQPGHPEVKAAITGAMARVHAKGIRTGILTGEPDVPHWVEQGATILLVGSDLGLLTKAADGQMQRLRQLYPAKP